MADQDVHAATTLTEMMRRRATLTPDKPYFHLYGETITYGRLWAASARYAAGLARADLRAGDKLCLIYPTCAEFFYTFFGALRMGAVPVPLYPTLSVEATARIFNDSEAVATFTVSPDFGYRNCVRHVRDTTGLDLTSLRAALSGAETVRPSTIGAFESRFGLERIISPCYGLAEATLAVAIWPRAVPLRFDPSGRFLSVGQPCPGVSVKIVARDAGSEVPLAPDEEGEIWVQSPGVMTGYYNNPEDTRTVLLPGGWLRTGDLGFVDKEGFLYVTGRLKDLIILAGENVPPADVEEIVDQVDGVRYSAAVGIESERAGTQRLHVVAEVRGEGAPPEEYHGLVREIVSRVHKQRGHRPARVLLVRAGTVPKTSSGKIQRSRLVEMIQRGELHDRIVYGTPERTVLSPPPS